jgi:hypothetical protein
MKDDRHVDLLKRLADLARWLRKEAYGERVWLRRAEAVEQAAAELRRQKVS